MLPVARTGLSPANAMRRYFVRHAIARLQRGERSCWKAAESGIGMPPTTMPVSPQMTALMVVGDGCNVAVLVDDDDGVGVMRTIRRRGETMLEERRDLPGRTLGHWRHGEVSTPLLLRNDDVRSRTDGAR